MESVLLGLAAPVAASSASNLVEGTLRAAAEPFAALLHAFTSAISPEDEQSTAVPDASLHNTLDALGSRLAANIEDTLAHAGVSLSEPFELRVSSADGHLEVVGEHSQKALIEAALAENPDLAAEFRELAGIRQVLAEADNLDSAQGQETIPLGQTDDSAVTALFTADDDGATLEFS